MLLDSSSQDIVRTGTYKGETQDKAQIGAILLGPVNGNGH